MNPVSAYFLGLLTACGVAFCAYLIAKSRPVRTEADFWSASPTPAQEPPSRPRSVH